MAGDFGLGTASGRIDIDASGARAGFDEAGRAAEASRAKSDKAATALIGAGTAIGGVGVAIAAGFGYAVKVGTEFEKRMDAIGAVSGATEKQMEKVRAKALQLGADTAFSAGESASAMEELIKAGLSVEDVINGAADATVNLAAAGEVDLTTAAAIAANAMNQFGLDAAEMPHIADLIAGAANASAISVEDFGMSMSQAGAVAKLAGLSFDDMAVAVTAMGNAGIKGSDAGTSLKTFLQNLQPQTEKQIGLMKELGIVTEDGANQFFDATGKIKSMADIAGVLGGALEGMSDAQKTATLETLFGSDAIRAAAVIAGEGKAGMEGLADAMGKVKAADVAKDRMDNLAGAVDALKGSAETFAIKVHAYLEEPLKRIVQQATGVINKFNSLDDKTLETGIKFAAMASGVLMAVGGFLIIVGAIIKARNAMLAFNAVMAANPMVLMVVGIAALIAALTVAYFKFQWFRDLVDNLFDGVQALFAPLVATIQNFTSNAVEQLGNLFAMFRSGDADGQGFAEILDNIFGNTGKLIPTFIRLYGIGKTVWDYFGNTVVPAVSRIVESLGGMDQVLKYVGAAMALLLFPIPSIIAGFAYLYARFEGFRNIVNTVASVILNVLIGAFSAWLTYMRIARDVIGDVAEWVGGKLVTGFNALSDAITYLTPGAKVLADTVGGALVTAFRAVSEFIAYMTPGVKSLAGTIQDQLGQAVSWLARAWEVLYPQLKRAGEYMGGALAGRVQIIIDTFKDLWPQLQSTAQSFADVLVPAIQKVAGWIGTGIEKVGGIKRVLLVLGGVFALVTNPIGVLIAALIYAYNRFEAFRNVVNTVAGVLGRALVTAFQAIQSAIDAVIPVIGMLAEKWLWFAQEMLERWMSLFGWIQANVFPIIGALAQLWLAVATRIVEAWKTVWPAIEIALGIIIAYLQNVVLPVFQLVWGLVSTIVQNAISVIQGIISVFVDLATSLWRNFGDNLWNAISIAWDLIRNTVTNALNFIQAIIQTVTALIRGDWSGVWEGIKGIASAVWQQIQTLVRNGINIVHNVIDGALSFIRTIWDTAWSAIVNGIRTAMEVAGRTVSTGVAAVVDFFKALPGRVLSALATLAGNLITAANGAMNRMKDAVEGGIGDVLGFFSDLPGRIIRAIGDLGGILLGAGRDIIQGLIDGVEDMIGNLTDVLGGVTDLIPDIKGPPRRDKVLLKENGRLIMGGLINGMESMVPLLTSSLQGITKNMPAMAAGMPNAYLPAAGGGGGVNLVFDFSNGTFGPGAEGAVKAAVKDPDLLGAIVNAAKAGAGAR